MHTGLLRRTPWGGENDANPSRVYTATSTITAAVHMCRYKSTLKALLEQIIVQQQ